MTTKILQIDDDFVNNMANNRLLRKMGIPYQLKDFLDPTEALEFLSTTEEIFDLILLDINMPRLSGWEFLDRYELFTKKFPIIMVTSSLDPTDHKKAHSYPSLTGFYIKPLSREKIHEIIELALGWQKQA
ncbi:MAG: response regulator [bacterium]|nr:response regulator [bacterium]